MTLRSLVLPALAAVTFGLAPATLAQTYSTPVTASVTANYTGGLGGSIPDNNPAGITTSINISPLGSIISLNSVTITGLTHTYSGDLAATLGHGGSQVNLFDSSNESSDFGGTYTFTPAGASLAAAGAAVGPTVAIPGGTYASSGLFSTFGGVPAAGDWSLNIVDAFAVDTGSFTGWSFNATTQVVNTIPDGTGSSISNIVVSDSFNIASLNSVTITGLNHSFIGDLTAQLINLTTGTTVDLFSHIGASTLGAFGDSSDLGGDYTFTLGGASLATAAASGSSSFIIPAGTYAASTSQIPGQANLNTLASFAGQNIGGTWRLLITDTAGGDTGFYTGWRFGVTAAATSAAPEPASLALILPALLLLAPAARRRLRREKNA